MSFLRIFFVGGLISYRALFNWIRPWIYIPTMLGAPLFQIVFFTYLGRYSQAADDDAFFIVGNAVQVCGMSCVYGMTMAVANERWFGTLGPLLASPANRVAVFLGRGVPVFANGLLVSAFGFAVGAVLLGFRPDVADRVGHAVSCPVPQDHIEINRVIFQGHFLPGQLAAPNDWPLSCFGPEPAFAFNLLHIQSVL